VEDTGIGVVNVEASGGHGCLAWILEQLVGTLPADLNGGASHVEDAGIRVENEKASEEESQKEIMDGPLAVQYE
jgi:hypothetical protein